MRNAILWVSSVLFNASVFGAGPVYQWEDEAGQRHYSDRPPLHTRAEKRTMMSVPATPGPGGAGLRAGERRQLDRLREAARRAAEDARNAGERGRRAASLTDGTCRDLKGRIRDYTDELRRGCRARRCEDLKWQRREARRQLRVTCG